MELNEFVAHFAEQFEETDASVFTPATKYHDLEEWSSLIGLSVIAMVDDEYDVMLRVLCEAVVLLHLPLYLS